MSRFSYVVETDLRRSRVRPLPVPHLPAGEQDEEDVDREEEGQRDADADVDRHDDLAVREDVLVAPRVVPEAPGIVAECV